MTTKQVKFFDSENQAIHGGILINDETLICGCCGSRMNGTIWALLSWKSMPTG